MEYQVLIIRLKFTDHKFWRAKYYFFRAKFYFRLMLLLERDSAFCNKLIPD
jgi:hypothetical protein